MKIGGIEMYENVNKLIDDYKSMITELQRRANLEPKFKDECFYRVMQLKFIVDDLTKIVASKLES